MKIGTIAALGTTLSLCACATRPPEPLGEPVALTTQEMKIVDEGVRKGLKDPESARFGDIRAVKRQGGKITVCGFVNAKNSFGGYTGMKPFAGSLSREPSAFLVIAYGGDRFDDMYVYSACRQLGLELGPPI